MPSILSWAGVSKTAVSQLVLDGQTLEVTVRPNSRARRIILRLDKAGTGIVLTVPPGTSHSRAMDFAASQGPWIWQQLAKQPDTVGLGAGNVVPVRGIDHRIFHSSEKRTPVWPGKNELDQPVLYVSGEVEHHARRVKDWLKKQARADLTDAAFSYAEKMDVTIKRISIRDTSSRWGSCSSDGALSFSWRLILAPAFVLDYVAAHEVAHLLEMNHSRRFWKLVEIHCEETKTAKKWLKANGRSLHRYVF